MSKYRNVKTVVDNIKFDSKKEAKRWFDLNMLQKAGVINSLERQKKFKLDVNGQLICTYIADFTYGEGGEFIVEDVKSPASKKLPAYRLKKKLMLAIYGIEILET